MPGYLCIPGSQICQRPCRYGCRNPTRVGTYRYAYLYVPMNLCHTGTCRYLGCLLQMFLRKLPMDMHTHTIVPDGDEASTGVCIVDPYVPMHTNCSCQCHRKQSWHTRYLALLLFWAHPTPAKCMVPSFVLMQCAAFDS